MMLATHLSDRYPSMEMQVSVLFIELRFKKCSYFKSIAIDFISRVKSFWLFHSNTENLLNEFSTMMTAPATNFKRKLILIDRSLEQSVKSNRKGHKNSRKIPIFLTSPDKIPIKCLIKFCLFYFVTKWMLCLFDFKTAACFIQELFENADTITSSFLVQLKTTTAAVTVITLFANFFSVFLNAFTSKRALLNL